jgi:polysaccharide biosynthesis transport protein
MRIGLNSAQDVLALIIRRKWWVLAPFLLLSSAIAVFVTILPRAYISEATILVRPRDVPRDFVKDLIATSAEDRLKAIEQTILSRPILVQILREFGDRLPEYARLNMDQKVSKLRGQIQIDMSQSEGPRDPFRQQSELTYFRISYSNQNPELAQKIASKLTTLFIEQDNKTRETQVFGTTEFLAAELEKVGQFLNESEERLKQVKSSRQFELPEQRDANLRTLDRLTSDKKANAEALDRQATLRLNLETQLAQTPQYVPKVLPAAAPAQRNPMLDEYVRAQSEFNEVSSKYTAKHPDVVTAKSKLERLKKQLPPDLLAMTVVAEEANAPANNATENKPGDETIPAGMEPNPVYIRLTAQLQDAKTEFAIREREKTWIDSQIGKYNGRLENTPTAEQAIAEVERHNADLKKQYTDLNEKLSQARLSESLESKQKGSQFEIIDPANYPIVPAKPNKPLVFLGGSLLSLALAIAMVAAVEIARQKVWTQSQVESFWGVPVLVDIPEIVTDVNPSAVRKNRIVFAASSLVAMVAYSFCLYGMYLNRSLVLQRLDPIVQKLVYK